jgi:hypothetical protein
MVRIAVIKKETRGNERSRRGEETKAVVGALD